VGVEAVEGEGMMWGGRSRLWRRGRGGQDDE